jgi:hypothetical protein
MTEIESKREMHGSEVTEYLRAFAAELDTSTTDPVPDQDDESRDERVTFMVGNDSATINPPERVTVGSDDSLVGNDRAHEVEFELTRQTQEAEGEEHDSQLEIR